MSKVKIKIVIFGHLPYDIDFNKIKKWKSDLFEVVPQISSYSIIGKSDGEYWEFSDENIERQLPDKDGAAVLIAVTAVALESNYFARRFSNDRVCVSFYEMEQILRQNNIPLENLLLRVLYSVSFVYRRYGNKIPMMNEVTNFTHDDTRGCIFDMNGIKSDIVYSLNKPQLCGDCFNTLINNPNNRIERNLIEKVQKELKRIKKAKYFEIVEWVKRKPILALVISSFIALLIGIASNAIWEVVRHCIKK